MDQIREKSSVYPKPVEGKGYEDEKGMQGLWRNNNQPTGMLLLRTSNNILITFKDNIKHGPYEELFVNDKVKERGTYVNGKKEGPYKEYDYDGKIKQEGTYTNGKKDDTIINYTYSDERLIYKSVWDRSTVKANGKWESYNSEGGIELIGNYNQGQKEGLWTFYNKDGTLYAKGNYVNDKKEGTWEHYEDDKLSYITKWKNDNKIEHKFI